MADIGLEFSLRGDGFCAPQSTLHPGSPLCTPAQEAGSVPCLLQQSTFPPQSQDGLRKMPEGSSLGFLAPGSGATAGQEEGGFGQTGKMPLSPVCAQAGRGSGGPTWAAAHRHVLTGVCIMVIGQSQMHATLLLQCDTLAEAPILFQASERQGKARPQ